MGSETQLPSIELSKVLYKWFTDRDWYLYANTIDWRKMDFIKNSKGMHVTTKVDEDMVLHLHGNAITFERIVKKKDIIIFACHVGDPKFFNKLSIALDEF